MMALDARYHAKCLAGLYNRARKVKSAEYTETESERALSATVFAKLVLSIDETRVHEKAAPIFKLADLAHLYMSRMEQLGGEPDSRVHTTRLKQRILAQLPD